MDYKVYQAQDFLLDESFQKFCLGTDQKQVTFWETWISLNPAKLKEIQQAKNMYYVLNGNNTQETFNYDQKAFLKTVDEYFRYNNNGQERSEKSEPKGNKKQTPSDQLNIRKEPEYGSDETPSEKKVAIDDS